MIKTESQSVTRIYLTSVPVFKKINKSAISIFFKNVLYFLPLKKIAAINMST